MLWVYVLLTTVGIVAIVPTLLRAIDDLPDSLVTGFVGFACTFAGLTGLLCRQLGVGRWTTVLAALALGLGLAAVHPELLARLRPPTGEAEPVAADDDMVESRHNND